MAESSTILLLISICLGLLLLLVLMTWSISQRLGRLERTATRTKPAEAADAPPSAVETSPGGAFEAFLSEDPARQLLPKSDQFKAYRKWRQEKGMNWSNS